MRYCIKQALAGVDERELATTLRRFGYKWKFQRRVLFSGNSAKYRQEQHTGTPRKIYTWNIEETHGFIRVYDLKRVK